MPSKRTMLAFTCVVCASSFESSQPHARYCGQICKKAYYVDKYQIAAGFVGPLGSVVQLTSGTRGAWAELIACADLMQRGFHVFRAVSPSCPCDLVVWTTDGRVLRVEVKSAGRNPVTGRMIAAPSKRNEFDVMCYVLQGEVVYDPPIEQW